MILERSTLFFVSCSSQEYTTAKLAVQQSDFKKAAEWLPKAMAVEPDNPEIPLVLAVEVYAQNGEWTSFVEMFKKAMSINPDKQVELRGAYAPVKETVKNYTEYYWAAEFNSGVGQFKKIEEEFNGLLDIEILRNRADDVLSEAGKLFDSALIGAVLAMAIIYLFLRNIRSTMVVALAIPTAALCVFIGMYIAREIFNISITCLLYTSDAADE